MISWYIDSSKNDPIYLEKVRQTVEPCINYFCDRLDQIVDYDFADINRVFREIIEELPILSFRIDVQTNDFYFQYNSYTQIRFNDSSSSIKREIVLNRILKIN